MERFNWSGKTASHYLYLWKKSGYVQPLGGHSNVFANVLAYPVVNWEHALEMAMPSAILCGVEVLRQEGWCTQIQKRPNAAVRAKELRFKCDRFTLISRPEEWFEAVSAKGLKRSEWQGKMLKPAWALADMLAYEGWGHCGLGPDDIDLDDATEEDDFDWVEACEAFGLNVGKLSEQSTPSR